ncbi:hypothetical protein [Haloglomus salinum]|uniref:hypothetical protein n=1 Tax=Haloglomus salinum TaxID=2962673 RepID=UPI0020C97731|nr:hypothetical protein [Haloglomus salinum]
MARGPTQAERIAAARAVVYEDDGSLIGRGQLADALREYGVTVEYTENGSTQYRDVPPELPLEACRIAVDLQRDPAAFVGDHPSKRTQ